MQKEKYIQFAKSIEDILENDKIFEMKNYTQHRTTNCYNHCLYVAYISYCLSTKASQNRVQTARGAMLHDFFLYDWHVTKNDKLHAFAHGRIALDNSEKIFELTDREREIILRHMWPVTPRPPRYLATYIVSTADKYCAIMEFFGLNKRFLRNVRELGIA